MPRIPSWLEARLASLCALIPWQRRGTPVRGRSDLRPAASVVARRSPPEPLHSQLARLGLFEVQDGRRSSRSAERFDHRE